MGPTAGVIGASGYAGGELLRLLARHPGIDLIWAAARRAAGEAVGARHPGLAAEYPDLAFSSVEDGLLAGADVVFLALPHGESSAIVERLRGRAEILIDLSADFRLRDAAAWATWYGSEHAAPDQLGAWAYGLPELWRPSITGARRVAVPGCYPTAALLALGPLVREAMVEPGDIVVDAKSGLSGAGRSLQDRYLFAAANENVTAYGLAGHRHTPEIEQQLAALAGGPVGLVFVPHLVPMTRGLLATCHARAAAGVGADELAGCLADAYLGEPFVDVCAPDAPPRTRAVVGTNRAQVAVTLAPGGRVVALGAIDNLGKGAAGQAVQCANLALGQPETNGLDLVAAA